MSGPRNPLDVLIGPVAPPDAGEILTLQRAAFASEALLYDDPALPPLVQGLEELRAELADAVALKATRDARLVGAVRGRVRGRTAHVGRLVVAPDLVGRGVGARLMAALEREMGPSVDRFELFTGHRSERNLRLYERLGYRERARRVVSPRLTLVFLEKRR